MKLYYAKGACSLVPRIIINEINIPCEFESVDLQTKTTQSGKNFNDINPKSYVPTIETDDHHVLTENSVILQYLADHYDATSLLPGTKEFHRYQILEWVNFVTTELHKNFGVLFKPQYPEEMKKDVQIPLLQQKFAYVDKQLSKTKYLTGDQFSLPDAYLFVMLMWSIHLKVDLKNLSHLTQFFNTMLERPSVKKSLEEEGIRLRAMADA